MTPEPLPESLARRLAADVATAGWLRLEYASVIGSTNDRALALAAGGAPEGTAVLAERQESGRGRRGRGWFSPAGAGLYFSLVTRPSAAALPLVTLAAGVALARGVRTATGLPVELKWPNDLVIGRPWRKLAGVLAEASGVGGRAEAVVIGIGLNVGPTAFPSPLASSATSLELELGRSVDRDDVLMAIAGECRTVCRRLREEADRAWVRSAWREFGHAGLGGTVRWTDADRERRGIAVDVAPDGALLVETPEGTERLVAGEVLWERRP